MVCKMNSGGSFQWRRMMKRGHRRDLVGIEVGQLMAMRRRERERKEEEAEGDAEAHTVEE